MTTKGGKDELTRITHTPAGRYCITTGYELLLAKDATRAEAMRFDLDEPLIDPEHALPGLLPLTQIAELTDEWKAAKIDAWGAVAALGSAASRLRRALNLPDAAPIAFVINEASMRSPRDVRVRRALKAYEDAATAYEGVRVVLADIRNRTTA